MLDFLKIEGIESINTSESTFGDAILRADKVIIPFFNVNVFSDQNEHLKKYVGKYIKYCYLIFEETIAITWDYDISRYLEGQKRECYGGIYYRNNNYYEFWLKYNKAFIVLPTKLLISSHPWSLDESDDYFNVFNENLNYFE